MTLTAHSLIAAALVAKIPNPALGLPIVLISHFVMDKVPHWDAMTDKNKSKTRIARDTALDIFLGFASSAVFFLLLPGLDPVYFFLAVFMAQLPDLLEAPYVFPQFNNPLSATLYKIQHIVHDFGFDSRLGAPWGIVSQVVITAAFLWWALW